MRGGSPRASEIVSVPARQFEWDRCLLAILRHSTISIQETAAGEMMRATPLREVGQLGRRDRLSLLAQFAAHQGLLRFAGMADGELDPAEWVVVQKRGTDCRLLRVAARAIDAADAPPVLTITQQFAETVGVPSLDVFRQSWARAESIFIESFARLRDDAAADLRWTRRSAGGALLAPGIETLREIASGQPSHLTYSDPRVVEALESFAAIDASIRVVVLRGSAIVRYDALHGLAALGLTAIDAMQEAVIVERVSEVLPAKRTVFVIVDSQKFDPASARVVQMLRSAGEATWLIPDVAGVLPRTRWYVVAPRISAAAAVEEQLQATASPEQVLDRFVTGEDFGTLLDRGVAVIGDARLDGTPEPLRSYLAALSLLGECIPRGIAEMFLRELAFERPLEELCLSGVTEIRGNDFWFVSAVARRSARDLVPHSSRAALCRVAAAVCEARGDPSRAATLLIDGGDSRRAAEVLAGVVWTSDDALLEACDAVPRRGLTVSPDLTSRYARALVRAARYHDARDVAAFLEGDERELVLAQVERRTGDYGPALARLERIARSCEADLLRAEILLVERRDLEALELLGCSEPSNEDLRVQLGYALALAGDDGAQAWLDSTSPLRPYYAARLATYRELDAGNVAAALDCAATAMRASVWTTHRIDVRMDQVFSLFSCGRWEEARNAALTALAEVEETQGDRAAGGLLFLLAYLAADEGQWAQASQRISRLRHFYGVTRDARHLAELDLLGAHLDFSRGRFDEARRAASSLLERPNDESIRAAAGLIVDEAAWIGGADSSPALTKEPSNTEFADRWRTNALRSKSSVPLPEGTFNRSLALWQRTGGVPPAAQSRSEKLKLFRAAAGIGRRTADSRMTALAAAIACELGIAFDSPQSHPSELEGELRLLRAAATYSFPFPAHAFDRHWRYVARNRLGQWNESGSLPPLGRDELDTIAADPPADWITCSERELLYVDGIGSFPEESREAVAAAFRARAELHRLQRIVDQDQAPARPRAAVAGVVGESPAIREVVDRALLIARRDVAVCVLGESGTGKELIARAIHSGSPRRSKPFTAINCSALPDNLIESELFGHVRGAFTGADRDRPGLVEVSDGGTLFLDEIGEMPLSAQAKLLRFLQEGEFRRVGETVARSADVRVVTATNRKLDQAVEQGRFREDLYYRIAAVEIVIPPLRERGNDVLALALHFLALEHARQSSGPSRFSTEVEAVLMAYSWPGNVRELQNAIRGAHAVAGDGKEIGIEHLTERLRNIVVRRTVPGSYQDAVARFRRDLVERALDEAGGNQNRAAAMLKISRQALGYQIRELGILVARRPARTAV